MKKLLTIGLLAFSSLAYAKPISIKPIALFHVENERIELNKDVKPKADFYDLKDPHGMLSIAVNSIETGNKEIDRILQQKQLNMLKKSIGLKHNTFPNVEGMPFRDAMKLYMDTIYDDMKKNIAKGMDVSIDMNFGLGVGGKKGNLMLLHLGGSIREEPKIFAAHCEFSETIILDVKNGRILSKEELFPKDKQAALEKMLLEQYHKEGLQPIDIDEPKVNLFVPDSFDFTKKGIEFVYPASSITFPCYTLKNHPDEICGAVSLTVPWKKVKNVLGVKIQ